MTKNKTRMNAIKIRGEVFSMGLSDGKTSFLLPANKVLFPLRHASYSENVFSARYKLYAVYYTN